MNVIGFLERRSRSVLVVLGLALVVVLALIDYLTGPDLSFLIFYFIPAFLVAWFVGKWAGVLVSVASAIPWLIDDVLPERVYAHLSIPYWNVTVKLGVFVIFALVVSALKASQEREKAAVEETFRREIEIAREVQARLFPQNLPLLDTLDYTGTCVAARGVGGDYYDFLPLGQGKLGMALADISGKGISAALLMASLQAFLRSHILLGSPGIDALVKDISRMLFECVDSNKYATLFYGTYDDARRTLTYVNAGHNPPMLFRPAGPGPGLAPSRGGDAEVSGSAAQEDVGAYAVVRLKAGGMPIGLFPDAGYQQESLEMRPGDILVVFSDGIVEATDTHEREFGEKRLAELVGAHAGLPAKALADRILADVSAFRRGAPQQDDETLVVAKVI